MSYMNIMNGMNNDSIMHNFKDPHPSVMHFNTKNQLVLYNETTIWTYSAHGRSCVCEEIEEIPEDYKLTNVSKDGKRYLSLDNYIYELSDVNNPARRPLNEYLKTMRYIIHLNYLFKVYE